jgi:hypothetical protein
MSSADADDGRQSTAWAVRPKRRGESERDSPRGRGRRPRRGPGRGPRGRGQRPRRESGRGPRGRGQRLRRESGRANKFAATSTRSPPARTGRCVGGGRCSARLGITHGIPRRKHRIGRPVNRLPHSGLAARGTGQGPRGALDRGRARAGQGPREPPRRMNSRLGNRDVRLRGRLAQAAGDVPRRTVRRCAGRGPREQVKPCSCRASARDRAYGSPSGGFTRSGRSPADEG